MRAFALAATLCLALAAPAGAQERLCHGQHAPKPEPSAAEKRLADLEHWAQARAEFGFRHDLAYVRKLVRAGVWEYDVGYIPVTPRENEYLKLRDRLELGARADRYLRAHRDVYGGLSVEDGWPREPYLLVRLKRDLPRHLAALKQLARFPDNLRVKRVRWSERELKRIADRIWRDDKRLEAEGFHLTGTGLGAGSVHVSLITARTDATPVLRRRYGAAVEVEIEAREPYSFDCVPSSSYSIAPDGMSLVLSWSSGGGRTPSRVEVREYPDRVEVGAVERVYNGSHTLELIGASLPAPLSAPLGDRAVIDAASGRRLIQTGPSPGDPPCPPRSEPTDLQRAIERRRGYAMRADAAYVQRLLDRRRLFTKAEQRWVDRVEAIDHGDEEKIDADLRARVDEYAGSVVLATYPNPPVVVYRFTRGARERLAAIRRRSEHPGAVRVQTAEYAYDALEALAERVSKEAQATAGFIDGWGRAGFYVAGAGVDVAGNRVRVLLFTTRPDHAAFFAARYGPAVATEVRGERFECRSAAPLE